MGGSSDVVIIKGTTFCGAGSGVVIIKGSTFCVAVCHYISFCGDLWHSNS